MKRIRRPLRGLGARADRIGLALIGGSVAWPGRTLAGATLLIALFAAFLPGITKDTSNKAYIPHDHPARIATDWVSENFDVSDDDSITVLITRDDDPLGIFHPSTLKLIVWLTERIEGLGGVEEVRSLATEKDIIGSDEGLEVEPFLDPIPASAEEARRVEAALGKLDLYLDRLVTRDGRATVISVELLEEEEGEEVYREIQSLVRESPRSGEQIHIAGLGAYNALIGDYIDSDLQRLNPVAACIILLVLFAAYRTMAGVWVPGISAIGGVVIAFGSMALAGVPIFGITSSLSVILIAVGVLDGIHIMGEYYRERAQTPEAEPSAIVSRTMTSVWRPLSITSFTTIAGFLALSLATDLPPMRFYGLFAALGVLTALLLALTAVPAALVLTHPSPSRSFRSDGTGVGIRSDAFGRLAAHAGRSVSERPRTVVGLAALLVAGAVWGASRMRVDNEPTAYLGSSEPLRLAEVAMNERFGGVTNLHLVVQTAAEGGLYEPDLLRRIESVQSYAGNLPHVKSSLSLVDYVKQIHRAMHADDPEMLSVPDDVRLVAQYLLLYSSLTGPSELDHVTTPDARSGLVHIALDEGRSSTSRRVFHSIERMAEEGFRGSGATIRFSGWAYQFAYWHDEILRSQWVGVPCALVAVLCVTAITFGSVAAGLLATTPVALAIVFMYALMGVSGIRLNIATSMTGAIAVGIAVDFAVHTVSRLQMLLAEGKRSLDDALASLFAFTGRALIFNLAAVLLGFGVLLWSAVPSVREFGALITICIATSFAASLTLLPAVVQLTGRRALGHAGTRQGG